MYNVVHLSRGNSILIQDFGPVLHNPMLPVSTPDGPSAPRVSNMARVPVQRSMREAYYLPKDLDAAGGMIAFGIPGDDLQRYMPRSDSNPQGVPQ